MDKAAEEGNLQLLIQLHTKGNKCTTCAMDDAARNGHLEIIKWLHENRTDGCTKSANAQGCMLPGMVI